MAQSAATSDSFHFSGQLVGRDTGRIFLIYYDRENVVHDDTAILHSGSFSYSGSVNKSCEGMLWTDIRNRAFDDSSVVRFLLSPGEITLTFDRSAGSTIFTGSPPQEEKEAWDRQNDSLLTRQANIYVSLYALLQKRKSDTSIKWQRQLDSIDVQRQNIFAEIRRKDLGYVRNNPDRFLSGYLLSRHMKKISVDTLQTLYTSLAPKVKSSSLGHLVLTTLYPLTNDIAFRKSNPLLDQAFNKQLESIHSVFDLSLSDSLGRLVSLLRYSGKWILIDFWASWCKPCLANVPALTALEKKHHDDPIVFLSVSLDNKKSDWLNTLTRLHFPGVPLAAANGFKSLTAVYCKALFVPTYVIVNPKGHIVQYDAPQALDPELDTILQRLISGGSVASQVSIH